MRVAVIGGGIQGLSVALELATRGISIDLIEANSMLMEGASRHNEGKIHLGFVYANDPTLRTAELMFRGATIFAPLMRRWLGGAFESIPVSTPFNYAVHRNSLLTPDQLEAVYRAISAKIHVSGGNGAYFGIDDPHVVERLAGSDDRYGPLVEAVFSTREVAVHPGRLADLMTETVSNCDVITVVVDAIVTSVSAIDCRVGVSTRAGSELNLGPYDHVINCAWGGRPALDKTAGFRFQDPWTFRMKYFVSATAPPLTALLPSTTVVLGGFGDLVDYGTGDYFLSWYPSGRLGWSTDLAPPAWPTRPEPAQAMEIADGTLHHLESLIPGVSVLRMQNGDSPNVHGGLIYSLGDTDVDDPTSEFHRRSDIGPRSMGGYHSINTGKYTTAPLFAMQVADRVTEAG